MLLFIIYPVLFVVGYFIGNKIGSVIGTWFLARKKVIS